MKILGVPTPNTNIILQGTSVLTCCGYSSSLLCYGYIYHHYFSISSSPSRGSVSTSNASLWASNLFLHHSVTPTTGNRHGSRKSTSLTFAGSNGFNFRLSMGRRPVQPSVLRDILHFIDAPWPTTHHCTERVSTTGPKPPRNIRPCLVVCTCLKSFLGVFS